jgi:hypothetical protein
VNLSRLEKSAAKIAESLASFHPEWSGYMAEEPLPRGKDCQLVLRMPSSPENDDRLIWLSACFGEIMVGLGDSYCRVDVDTSSVESGTFTAINVIEDIIQERLVAVVRRGWIGFPTLRGLSSPEKARSGLWFKVVRVRSWMGSFDRGS